MSQSCKATTGGTATSKLVHGVYANKMCLPFKQNIFYWLQQQNTFVALHEMVNLRTKQNLINLKRIFIFFHKIYLILSTQGSGVKKWGGIMWEANRSELEAVKILLRNIELKLQFIKNWQFR